MKRATAGMFAFISVVFAQTHVNLSTQAQNVDFHAQGFVIPFPTGASLPPLCTQGSMFFVLSAPAGSNLAGCTATNTWTIQGGSSGAGGTSGGSGPQGMTVVQSSNTVLTIGGSCSPSAPCRIQIGTNVISYSGAASLTITGGSGNILIYIDNNGNITAGEGAPGAPGLSCAGCVLASSITQFPPSGIVPLATWSAAGGSWLSGNSETSFQSTGPSFSAGSNVYLIQTGTNVTISAFIESLATSTPSAQRPCTISTGGFILYLPGSPGAKDVVQVCAKDATNSFAWRTLY
jgi:hypothetical protein